VGSEAKILHDLRGFAWATWNAYSQDQGSGVKISNEAAVVRLALLDSSDGLPLESKAFTV
jgi:hypothetical protein